MRLSRRKQSKMSTSGSYVSYLSGSLFSSPGTLSVSLDGACHSKVHTLTEFETVSSDLPSEVPYPSGELPKAGNISSGCGSIWLMQDTKLDTKSQTNSSRTILTVLNGFMHGPSTGGSRMHH